MIPSVLARQLQIGIGDYIESSYPMTNEPFRGSMHKMVNTKDSVFHEPYISVSLPYRKADGLPTCFKGVNTDRIPYVHQQKAFDRLTGNDGRSTIIATGTGSGKTECFLYPILEYCYRHRGERGIKAIIIYPMNALATDQAKRTAGIIHDSPNLRGNVSCGLYVGGDNGHGTTLMTETDVISDHDSMINNPPDILMTNYKMLDYLLVRPYDSKLWNNNNSQTLKYIAVDELHTFDGAQGTDLACLLRRLKRRLGIQEGYLCCIGTSATIGARGDNRAIINYAKEIFGEDFEDDSVICEDRLSSGEFLGGIEREEFALPTKEDAAKLDALSEDSGPDEYLAYAASVWFPEWKTDNIMNDDSRVELGNKIMRHSVFQDIVNITHGAYVQNSYVAGELSSYYREFTDAEYADTIICSLYALISHARSRLQNSILPFLNVRSQLWTKELRRVVAKVDPDDVNYEFYTELNARQRKSYLPVVNCRDCGVTGWTTIKNIGSGNIALPSYDIFYNKYFGSDQADNIIMMFPNVDVSDDEKKYLEKLCPVCHHLFPDNGDAPVCCPDCGSKTISVYVPKTESASNNYAQYICPCCGSRRGIAIVGVRSAREISTDISELFASRFNDDKKVLAFSDNVQDATHKAGYLNSHTWRYSLRAAVQKYCDGDVCDKSLSDFQDGFVGALTKKYTNEEIVGYFTPPNLTWKHSYENTIKNNKFKNDEQGKILISEICSRLKYEVMLEYGISGKYGRTLEKTGCSVLSFKSEDIKEIAECVSERVYNELGEGKDIQCFETICEGILFLLKTNGAFSDPVFEPFLSNGFDMYYLTEKANRWLPGRQTGRNTPRFFSIPGYGDKNNKQVDYPSTSKYRDLIRNCLGESFNDSGTFDGICKIVIEESAKNGVLVEVTSSVNGKVYALNKDRVYVTNNVAQMRCSKCGSSFAVSGDEVPFWNNCMCLRHGCGGTLQKNEDFGLDYYGKLYKKGDYFRINAKEHTALLKKEDRDKLEKEFKRRTGKKSWDPNVLSCTPTLELGIDIGDLSTVILCSVPPSQSQFAQRAGRAGRSDGNALTVVIANSRPHDLYYYQDPIDMIEGQVTPPKIFLDAPAVLERQFVAYCMDSWVKNAGDTNLIPVKIGNILANIEKRGREIFPHNFLSYVYEHDHSLTTGFLSMFDNSVNEACREDIRIFAGDSKTGAANSETIGTMIERVFLETKKQIDSYRYSVDELQNMIDNLKSGPSDSSIDKDIQELRHEMNALNGVIRELREKNTFNFLSDEGVLPNYAFPEAGITLQAILYRRKNDSDDFSEYEDMSYEYYRPAATGISEFAPGNTFYADGKKMTIDQIDVRSSEIAKWRLCPNCSYAQLEEAGNHTAYCPRCGSIGWADNGQVKNMLKVSTVYSNMNYRDTLLDDSSDDRGHRFYTRQMLVDVDEEDIEKAYKIHNDKYDFGYEFDRKAKIRDINFGPADSANADNMSVAGYTGARKGFKVCTCCGKIQDYKGSAAPRHTNACIYNPRNATGLKESPYEDCLFLYREYDTETLRILIPSIVDDTDFSDADTFVAAFMLGMREHFGNVDHLNTAITYMPVNGSEMKKQYLVIYDSVPGGTGYLKQLVVDKNSFTTILEEALAVMENCPCSDDPEKDGCYHCIYAYRQSNNIGSISKKTAISMIKTILSGRDNVEEIKKIDDLSVDGILDSTLETDFIAAIKKEAGPENISDIVLHGKRGYNIKMGNSVWEVELQVYLDSHNGVSVACKPDFVFRPKNAQDKRRPVAVFTDGFTYHKDIGGDDTLKREAIRRSGKYRVWSLSYDDVQNRLSSKENYYTETLNPDDMPGNTKNNIYRTIIENDNIEPVKPKELTSFDMLCTYLRREDAEDAFKKEAKAYSYSLLDTDKTGRDSEFKEWNNTINYFNSQANFISSEYTFGSCIFGEWTPQNGQNIVHVYAGTDRTQSYAERAFPVCIYINDTVEKTYDYRRDWVGYLKFSNVMQFSDNFVALSESGMNAGLYRSLPDKNATETVETAAAAETQNPIFELIEDEGALEFCRIIMGRGIPIPENGIGADIMDGSGKCIGQVEVSWPNMKMGYMTGEQKVNRDAAEHAGWKIIENADEIDVALEKKIKGVK